MCGVVARRVWCEIPGILGKHLVAPSELAVAYLFVHASLRCGYTLWVQSRYCRRKLTTWKYWIIQRFNLLLSRQQAVGT